MRLFSVIYRILVEKSYSSAEMQSVYSSAAVDWATSHIKFFRYNPFQFYGSVDLFSDIFHFRYDWLVAWLDLTACQLLGYFMPKTFSFYSFFVGAWFLLVWLLVYYFYWFFCWWLKIRYIYVYIAIWWSQHFFWVSNGYRCLLHWFFSRAV